MIMSDLSTNTGNDLENFDWMNHKRDYEALYGDSKTFSLDCIDLNETSYEKDSRVLNGLKYVCEQCNMCHLGLKPISRDEKVYHNPHVFSNLNPKRFVIVGQNPGWNEVLKCQPFVGDSGANFETEIKKYGLSRDDFYITNAVKCYHEWQLSDETLDRCSSFLRVELYTIKPLIIFAFGAVAFSVLCPGKKFTESLFKVHKSVIGGFKVYPVYHPSPLNMRENRGDFIKQIKIMCGVVNKLKLDL